MKDNFHEKAYYSPSFLYDFIVTSGEIKHSIERLDGINSWVTWNFTQRLKESRNKDDYTKAFSRALYM